MKKTHSEHTLSNGLKILLKEIHTAPLISSWMWYRVGSRDETSGRTGISHWVEHMQFKGTPQFPASSLDRDISRDGGIWNAFTFMDWTAYLETMPADKIDLGLRLEADRMSNSLFDEKEVASERTVVISEREGNENEPLFLLGEAVQQAAFRVHPYHHEIIGDLVDLKSMSRDDLYHHYRTYYMPNNAIVGVAGDFKTSEMLARIQELFEPIPAGPVPARLAHPEPAAKGEHRLTVEGPGETTFLEISYHAPAGNDPDFFPLTVLDSLLAGPSGLSIFGGGGLSNKTSRSVSGTGREGIGGWRGWHHPYNGRPIPLQYQHYCASRPQTRPSAVGLRCRGETHPGQARPGRRNQPRNQTSAGPVCLSEREHHQPGSLAGTCRDVRQL